MAARPVSQTAVKQRLLVAAIDFGTTYSGYAFSFLSDFKQNPLKVHTNKWGCCSSGNTLMSMKAPSCVLFNPQKEFHSFGYEAEDHYSHLANSGVHENWYFFSRFKMRLYENKDLKRDMMLDDEKGLKMSALMVFSECIRYLKDHCVSLIAEKKVGLTENDTHWVLTVPAIWDEPAKQFMREAAVVAGIPTDQLSLAIEPEAASLFCRHLPVEQVRGADGEASLSCLAPGKRYLVLDAGGGTVDITVHETQKDGTVRELYKANGGPWGGTTIDRAFLDFLEKLIGRDVMDIFKRDFMEDFLDMTREFETKKKTLSDEAEYSGKINFRVPVAVRDTFQQVHGTSLRASLSTRMDLEDISFAGDKLKVMPRQVLDLFSKTHNHIVDHLRRILSQPAVQDTKTILMVGGFSESKMLQSIVRFSFPDSLIIVPEDASLAVLMGAVIYGHHPSAVISRISRFTYGVGTYVPFDPRVHSVMRKVVLDGKELCQGVFDKHVEIEQEVYVGLASPEQTYIPPSKKSKIIKGKIYASKEKSPMYTSGCNEIGCIKVDVSDIKNYKDREVLVKMIYGRTELLVDARKVKTGEKVNVCLDFLG